MAEKKYSWENLIFNPTTDEAKNAVGKEVYYSDAPLNCIDYANKDNTEFLGVLDSASEIDAPFYIRGIGNWNCIIVKKEPCYEDQVKQWVEENNLKVGDYVKITRRAENHADGLDDYWYDLTRDSVGKILKVKEISNFIMLDNGINYPYFVLEKIEPPKPKYVPFENVTEFLNAYRSVANWLGDQDLYLLNHGIWLKAKDADDALFMVTDIWSYGVVFSCNMKTTEELEGEYLTINEPTTWEQLLREYTFLDNSPCGKEVKDV